MNIKKMGNLMIIEGNYNRLSFSDKKIYRTLQQSIEALQTKIVLNGCSFNSIFNIYKMILDDHPEYFWLSGKATGSSIGFLSNSKLIFTLDIHKYFHSKDIGRMRQELDNIVTQIILKAKKSSPLLYEQILFIHDYLVTNTDYSGNAVNCFDSYGCLILKKAVCEGYSAAFQLLMHKIGVECGIVSGESVSERTGKVSHSWNYIKLSDGYYFVDVTWDDPITNNTISENISHEYFCLNASELKHTHIISNDRFVPQCSGEKFNYYTYHKMVINHYSSAEIIRIIEKQLISRSYASVKFLSENDLDLAIKEFINQKKLFSIKGVNNSITYTISKSGKILSIFT